MVKSPRKQIEPSMIPERRLSDQASTEPRAVDDTLAAATEPEGRAPTITVPQIFRLQRSVGNRAVTRALAWASHGNNPGRQPLGLIQRQIQGQRDFVNGTLAINMQQHTRMEGQQEVFGEVGDIRFDPKPDGPNALNIDLVQIAKSVDVDNASDVIWKGGERRRELTKTQAGDGVEAGAFVDRNAGRPRDTPQSPVVSPAYRESNPYKHEWTTGQRINGRTQPARISDAPAASRPASFHFETAVQARVSRAGAEAADETWGVVGWSFRTVKAGAGWQIADPRCQFQEGVSRTFEAALAEFHAVYRNPGSGTSPEEVEQARQRYQQAHSEGEKVLAAQQVNRVVGNLRRIASKPTPPYQDVTERLAFEQMKAEYRVIADSLASVLLPQQGGLPLQGQPQNPPRKQLSEEEQRKVDEWNRKKQMRAQQATQSGNFDH